MDSRSSGYVVIALVILCAELGTITSRAQSLPLPDYEGKSPLLRFELMNFSQGVFFVFCFFVFGISVIWLLGCLFSSYLIARLVFTRENVDENRK